MMMILEFDDGVMNKEPGRLSRACGMHCRATPVRTALTNATATILRGIRQLGQILPSPSHTYAETQNAENQPQSL